MSNIICPIDNISILKGVESFINLKEIQDTDNIESKKELFLQAIKKYFDSQKDYLTPEILNKFTNTFFSGNVAPIAKGMFLNRFGIDVNIISKQDIINLYPKKELYDIAMRKSKELSQPEEKKDLVIINSNLLFLKYYQDDTNRIFEYMKTLARRGIFNASICTREGVFGSKFGLVNNSRDLNINIMFMKLTLYSNVIEYLYKHLNEIVDNESKDLIALQYSMLFDDNGLRLKLTTRLGINYYADRGLFNTKQDIIVESGILENKLFQEVIRNVLLSKTGDLIKSIKDPHTIQNSMLILAYNSFVILNEFDNVILPMLTNGRLYVRPLYLNNVLKDLNLRYGLSSKTNVILDNFRTEDPDVIDETDPIIKMAIESIPKMPFGSKYSPSLLYESLSFTDYVNTIALIKKLALNPKLRDIKLNDMFKEMSNDNILGVNNHHQDIDALLFSMLLKDGFIHEQRQGEYTSFSYNNLNYVFNEKYLNLTFGNLVDMITGNPKKYMHLIFNLLCSPSFYNKYREELRSSFTLNQMNNLYSIYYHVFRLGKNRGEIESYYNITKNLVENFYSYLALNIATIYPSKLLQTYMDVGLYWSIRGFDGKELTNEIQNLKTAINNYNNIQFDDINKHYDLDSVSLQGKELIVKTKNGTITFEVLNEQGKIKPGEYFKIDNQELFDQNVDPQQMILKLNNFLPLIDKIWLTTFSEDLSFKEFMLKSNAFEIDNYTNLLSRLQFLSNLLLHGMRAFAYNWLYQNAKVNNKTNINFNKKNEVERWLEENLETIETDKKSGILYDYITNSISLVSNSSLPFFTGFAKFLLDYYGRYVKSQIKDSLQNGQSIISQSRLIGSHKYQFMDIQGKIDGIKGAASESFIFDEGVYRGFALVKELYTYSGEHKSDELLNASEFVSLSIIGYLSAFGEQSDLILKNIGWDGTALFLAAVMSDKKMIGHVLINIYANIEKYGIIGEDGNLKTNLSQLNSYELLELVSKTIGNTYYKILLNVIEDLNSLLIHVIDEQGNQIPLGLDYLTGFHNFNRQYNYDAYKIIKKAITQYNNEHPVNPIKFIEEIHFIKQKNGNISINKSFMANVVRWINETTNQLLLNLLLQIPQYKELNSNNVYELVTNVLKSNNIISINDSLVSREEFLLMKNIEMLEDLLLNEFKYNLEPYVLSKENDTYRKMFKDWIDNTTLLMVLAKVQVNTYQEGKKIPVIINITQTSDLIDLYYKYIDPYISNIYNQYKKDVSRYEETNNIINNIDYDNKVAWIKILDNIFESFRTAPSVRQIVKSINLLNSVVKNPVIENIIVNEMFARINMLDYLTTQEYLNATVGMLFAHPSKGNTIISDEASRFLALHKRNVLHTAAMQAYAMNMLEGIPKKYKVAVIEDLYDVVYNSFGSKDRIKPFDGATFVSPFAVYLENKSLGSASVGITKKLFVHSYDKKTASGVIVKTAGFGLTNYWMRTDPDILLNIFKKMTNIVWKNEDGSDVNIDITKCFHLALNFFTGLFLIESYSLLDTLAENQEIGKLYFKVQGLDGVIHYYRINGLEKVGENTYARTSMEVDRYGQDLGNEITEVFENVNTNYALWNLFGGLNSVERKNGVLIASENSIKAVVEAMNYCVDESYYSTGEGRKLFDTQVTQEDIYLPLKNSDIQYLITKGAIKEGYGNINPNTSYKDNTALDWFYLNMFQSGIQLDKEHVADDVEISLMTLVVSACAAKGYTFRRAMNLYKSLALLTKTGISNFLDPFLGIYKELDPNVVEQFKKRFTKEFNSLIIETLAEKDITSSNFATRLATEILDRIKRDPQNEKNKIENLTLPLSDNAFYNLMVSAVTIALTRLGIKLLVNGSLAVMTPSFNIIKLYNGKLYDLVVREAESQNKMVEAYMQELLNLVIPVKREIQSEDGLSTSVEVNIQALKVGRTYTITKRSATGDIYKEEIFLTPDNYVAIYDSINNNNTIDIVENISKGRDLGTYSVYFKDLGGKEYSMWLLDSVLKLRKIEIAKDFYKSKEYSDFIKMFFPNFEYYTIEKAIDTAYEQRNNAVQLLNIQLSKYYLNIYDNLLEIQKLKLDYLKYSGLEDGQYTFDDMINSLNKVYRMDFLKDMSILTKDEYEDIYELFNRFVEKCLTEYNDEIKLSQNEKEISTTKQRFYDKLYLAVAYLTKTQILLREDAGGKKTLMRPTSPFDILYRNTYVENLENVTIGLYIEENISKDVIDTNPGLNLNTILYIVDKANEKLLERSKVYINGLPINVDRNNISIDDYEVVMPKTAATNFGLKENDTVQEIVNNLKFFINRIKENFSTPYGINESVADLELKTFRGLHYFLSDSDSIIEDTSIVDATDNFVLKITSDGRKLLFNSNNEVVFELFNLNDRLLMKRNRFGQDLYIIRTSDMSKYIDNMSYNYINILAHNENVVNKIYNAVLNSDNEIAETFAESYKLVGYKGIADTEKLLIKNLRLNTNATNGKVHDEYEKHINDLGRKMWASFMHYLDIVAARIPAQSMQSFMKMRIAGFEGRNINNAYVSTMQLWLLGSDYDIDAVNLVTYNINKNGILDIHSPYARLESKETITLSFELPFPTGERVTIGILHEGDTENEIQEVLDFYKKYMPLFNFDNYNPNNREQRLLLKNDADLNLLKDFLSEKVIPSFNKELYFKSFKEETGYKYDINTVDKLLKDIKSIIDKHNLYLVKLAKTDFGVEKIERIALNSMQYNMLQIASDPANLLQSQAPLDEITSLAKSIASRSDKTNEQNTRTPGNFVNKYLSIEENAVGKACIAINAIGMKTYFYLTLYYNSVLNGGSKAEQERLLYKMLFDNKEKAENPFAIRGYGYNGYNIRLLPQVRCKDINNINSYEVLFNLGLMDYNADTALDLSVLISLSADNAKELVLAKLCINPKTNGMVIAGLLSGLSFSEIADLFMSPAGELIINMSKSDLFNSKSDTSSSNMDNIFSNIENIRIPNNIKLSKTITENHNGITFKEVLLSEFIAERWEITDGLKVYDWIVNNINTEEMPRDLENFVDTRFSNRNINTWSTKLFFESLFNVYDQANLQWNLRNMMSTTMKVLDRVFDKYFDHVNVLQKNIKRADIHSKTKDVINTEAVRTARVQHDVRKAFYNYSLIHGTEAVNKYNQIKRLYKISKILYDLGRLCSLNQKLPPDVKGLLNILKIFDKYDINLKQFATNPNYVNNLIQLWDQKTDIFINIPDFMYKSEMLYEYILILALAEELAKKSKKFRTIRSQVDNIILYERSKSDKDTTEEKTMHEIERLKKEDDFMRIRVSEAVEKFVVDYMKNKWLYDYFSQENFRIMLPAQTEVFNGFGEIVKLAEDSYIIPGDDTSNATLRKYLEETVIPKLKSGDIGQFVPIKENESNDEYNARLYNLKSEIMNNDVIKKLTYKRFNKTLSKNDTLIYTLPINMLPRSKDQSERALLILYLNALSELLSTTITLGELVINIPDLLFLYTMLSQDFRLGETTLTNLFSTLKSAMKDNYYENISQQDADFDNEIIFGQTVPYEALLPYYIKTGSKYYSYDDIILTRNEKSGLYEYFKNIGKDVPLNLTGETGLMEGMELDIDEVYNGANERYTPFEESDYAEKGFHTANPRYFKKGVVGINSHYITSNKGLKYRLLVQTQYVDNNKNINENQEQDKETVERIVNIDFFYNGRYNELTENSLKNKEFEPIQDMLKKIYDTYLKTNYTLKNKFKVINGALEKVYSIEEIINELNNEENCLI